MENNQNTSNHQEVLYWGISNPHHAVGMQTRRWLINSCNIRCQISSQRILQIFTSSRWFIYLYVYYRSTKIYRCKHNRIPMLSIYYTWWRLSTSLEKDALRHSEKRRQGIGIEKLLVHSIIKPPTHIIISLWMSYLHILSCFIFIDVISPYITCFCVFNLLTKIGHWPSGLTAFLPLLWCVTSLRDKEKTRCFTTKSVVVMFIPA